MEGLRSLSRASSCSWTVSSSNSWIYLGFMRSRHSLDCLWLPWTISPFGHFLRDEIRSTNHPFYKGFCHIYQVQEHRSLPLIHLLFIWISVSTWRCSSAATTFFRAMYLLIPRLPFGWGQESMKPVCESERERMEKRGSKYGRELTSWIICGRSSRLFLYQCELEKP